MMSHFRYRAFVSYKHVASRTFAVSLESALKSYARPLLQPPMRIFRDEKIIRAGDDLPEVIHTALRESEYLILIASPAAAESPWVADELRQWCGELNRADRLVIVLSDGEIAVDEQTQRIRWAETTALPALLSEFLTSLPVWVDVRGMSDKDWSLENLRFTDVVNSISARLRDVTPEEMNDAHVLQHRRNVRLRNLAVSAIVAMLAVATVTSFLLWLSRRDLASALIEVVKQRNTSESRRLAGLSALERTGGRLDVATLLAAEGLHFADTAEARSSLVASLQQWSGKEAVLSCADCEISDMAFRQTAEGMPRALLAIGTTRGDVLVRDLEESGSFVPAAAPVHRAAINALAFNPAGSLLASAGVGADQQLVLWKVGHAVDATPLQPLDVHPGLGWAVAFSPDGRRLAAARADGSIAVGDVSATGVEFHTRLRGHRGFVFTLAFAPDGEHLASGGVDGMVRVWSMRTGRLALEPLAGHRGAIGRIAFAPDGRLIASAGHDGTVRLWDAAGGKSAGAPLFAHGDLLSSLSFSADGAWLASGSRDGSVLRWKIATRELSGEPLRGHRGGVSSVAFLAAPSGMTGVSAYDGSLLASAGYDGTVVLWRLVGSGDLTRTIDVVQDASVLAFAPHGGPLAVAGREAIHVLDAQSTKDVGPPFDASLVATLAISPDGTRLAAGDLSGAVRLWDLASAAPVDAPLPRHDGFVHSVAFNPDGTGLASSGKDGVVVWDLANHHQVGNTFGGEVYSVAYSPDGRFLAAGDRDGTIVVRDAATLQPVGSPLEGHLQGVTGLAFLDASTLASGSYDGTVRLWRLPEGTSPGSPLRSTGAGVSTITLSPDGRMLAAGAVDGTITLWDIAERQVVGTPLRAHRGTISSLSFRADGRMLASAADDGPAVVWDVDPAAWLRLAEQLVRRSLTQEEWLRFVGSATPYRPTFAGRPDG